MPGEGDLEKLSMDYISSEPLHNLVFWWKEIAINQNLRELGLLHTLCTYLSFFLVPLN